LILGAVAVLDNLCIAVEYVKANHEGLNFE